MNFEPIHKHYMGDWIYKGSLVQTHFTFICVWYLTVLTGIRFVLYVWIEVNTNVHYCGTCIVVWTSGHRETMLLIILPVSRYKGSFQN